MSLNDPLSNALSNALNADKVGKKEITVYPVSNLIKGVLEVMNQSNYVGSTELIRDVKGDSIRLNLLGNLNNCKAIKPRFSVKRDGYEKFEKRFLPAKDFGILIVSTSKGLMTHTDAKKNSLGGKLLAYCY